MSTMSLARVSNWKAVAAAMLYLATSLAVIYGGFALVRGASFFESLVVAYPFALAACGVLFICSAAFETLQTAFEKGRGHAKRPVIHSYVHPSTGPGRSFDKLRTNG